MRRLGLTVCLLAILLATAGPAAAQESEPTKLPAPVVAANDDLTAALESGELSGAEYALERARSIFRLAGVRREFGDVARPAPHDATLLLRDLALRLRELTGADRVAANRILARPPQGAAPGIPGDGWEADEASMSPSCGGNVCVHWVDELADPDAPTPDDINPANDIPDWVDLTLQTWENVWLHEIDTLGYREPLSDLDSPDPGGNMLLDVYLEDLGSSGVFGYCTSDSPTADDSDVYAVSAYCVIDNDFEEFGSAHSPQEFLEVTSAHEFHHASQFGYDWLEDYWLMEGTATNIEESVYPDIDDNVNFLRLWSPLNRPSSPLDRAAGNSEYGAWIFWRFLEEKVAGDPEIVREIWERADAAAPGLPDDYSLEAVRKELSSRGLAFADVFADFGVANRRRDYVDAAEAGYPTPKLTRTYTVGRDSRNTGWRTWRINHLATRYLAFRPGRAVGGKARLRVAVKLPAHGARATLIVVEADGSTSKRRLQRNAKGYARASTRFGRAAVRRVELVLSNGSTRMGSCWTFPGPPSYSCLGRARDDRRAFDVRGRLR